MRLKSTGWNRYNIVLLLAIGLVFACIEIKYPYFFLQDDNRDFFLPVFVYDYRSLMNGELAQYNFHQFLGYPVFACGQSVALYPLTYISVFFSNMFFKDYFASIDIFVFIHLVIGALGFNRFLRSLNLDAESSLLGALAWPLSGFIIYASDSWVLVSGVSAYIPWIMYFSHRFFNGLRKTDFVLLAVFKLLLFYVGFYQYFAYTLIFEFLMILFMAIKGIISKTLCKTKLLLYYLFNSAFVFIVSLPLFLPVFHSMTASSERSSIMNWQQYITYFYDIRQWLLGLLNPFREMSGSEMFSNLHLGILSHIGYVCLIFVIFSLIWYFSLRKRKPKSRLLFIFLMLSIFALSWSSSAFVLYVIYQIPLLNRFRWPFKLELFTAYFMIATAAIGIHVFMNHILKTKNLKRAIFIFMILIQCTNAFCLYVLTPEKSFKSHSDNVPFKDDTAETLCGGRIITLAPNPQGDNDYANFSDYCFNTAEMLGFDYATLYNVYQFAGYDPLISSETSKACLGLNHSAIYFGKSIPFEYFRKWGVRYYIIPEGLRDNALNVLRLMYEDDKRTIYFDPAARPLVYWEGGSDENIGYVIKTNSIRIDAGNPEEAKYLNVNFLFNPFFRCEIDGIKAPIRKNGDGQISVLISEGSHKIIITYVDPYFVAGLYISGVFLLIAAIVMIKFLFFPKQPIKFINHSVTLFKSTGCLQRDIN